MIFAIKWTSKAQDSFTEIVKYLHENWSNKEIDNFVFKVQKKLNVISINPKLFQKSDKKSIHRVVITRHTSLYYRILNSEIHLLLFFDNRKNPKSRKYE